MFPRNNNGKEEKTLILSEQNSTDEIEPETVKNVPPLIRVTIKQLVVCDGSLTLRCPKCNSTWLINIHEQEWVYEEETKCRTCMREYRKFTTAELPIRPIWVEGAFGRRCED
jgi:hypothetical protein